MDSHTLLAILISSTIGMSLSLLGAGGSILAVPLLVYVARVEATKAVAMSLAIVGSTSALSTLLHARSGSVDLKAAAIFSATGAVGAFLGAKLTSLVAPATLLALFGFLMLTVATLMIARGRAAQLGRTASARERKLMHALLAGSGVGLLTGFLGVGGGFLIVPALVLFAGLTMRTAVGTSLIVITVNSFSGLWSHLWMEGSLPVGLTALFVLASAAGAYAGSKLGRQLSSPGLQQGFGYVVLCLGLALIAMNYRALL